MAATMAAEAAAPKQSKKGFDKIRRMPKPDKKAFDMQVR